MGIFDWITGSKKKGVTLDEVRREEIRLGIREKQSLAKLEKMEKEREALFQQGAKIHNPVKRRQLARMYELKSKNLTLVERDLDLMGKEMATISALKLALERNAMSKEGVSTLLQRMSETQLRTMLEDDKISQELYNEKLTDILGTVTEASREIMEEVGTEGSEVLDVWQKMDEGEIQSVEAGLSIARQKVKVKERGGQSELEEA